MKNKEKNGVLVGIVGTIGSGKSTTGKYLKSLLKGVLFEEDWKSIPYVYGKKSVDATQLDVSIGFLLMRYEQNKKAKRYLQKNIAVVMDSIFENTDHYSRTTLDEVDYKNFKIIYNKFAEDVRNPDVIIYLKGDYKVFIERALKRKWGIKLEDQFINVKTLQSADQNIKRYLKNIKIPVITLDTSRYDIREQEVQKMILKKIKNSVK